MMRKGEIPRKKPYKKPEAVRLLEELADIEQQRKHPNTPAKYLAPCKYRDDTATATAAAAATHMTTQ